VVVDYPTDTWVVYTTDHKSGKGQAVISRSGEIIETVEMAPNIPHNYVLWTELDGDDVWVGTSKGLGHGIGKGYFPRLREPSQSAGIDETPETAEGRGTS
jgi:hypothetical protein